MSSGSKSLSKNPSSLNDMANAIRFLAIDAVERAASGHPGMPMGMADTALILFSEFLKFDPDHPAWPDRDRFVLSAGHGSMLLYALLYLTGYKGVTLEEIRRFRQLGSKTAGHPEYGELPGVETTTGPLGQGLANAVGMALAERMLAARFGEKIVNHKTYCLVGDGCLMEGISQEAISLAGHLNLSKLIVLWDNNGISIDGKTDLTISDNNQLRFSACGWQVLSVDGHNFEQVREALSEAQNSDRPVLIDCRTTIAYGSPGKAGSEKSHGAPLGSEEVKQVRKNLNWPYAPFEIPDEILKAWRKAGKRGQEVRQKWQENLNKSDEKLKTEFERLQLGQLPDLSNKFAKLKQKIFLEKPEQPTRKSSGEVLEILTKEIPELIGGSADLTGSVNTKTSLLKPITRDDFSGRYIYYGVREHAMGAIMNGLVLHKGFIPYGGTFLAFSDYMRPPIRLSALMKQRVIYIFSHDSIGLGEDGPTHQPVEQLAALRAIPNLNVFRPCDASEVVGCFEQILRQDDQPAALILSRQNVGFFRSEYGKTEPCSYGGYIISDTALNIEPDVVIIATGSEMGLAMQVKERLHKKNGIAVRMVSLPCFELFNRQEESYQRKVLGPASALRVGIEAGIRQGWDNYLGKDNLFFGMEGFGASGKAEDLYEYFGLSCDNITKKISEELSARRQKLAIKAEKPTSLSDLKSKNSLAKTDPEEEEEDFDEDDGEE